MAYVLSSISGNLISAASAGFAPTNGADVSAIASAYQVVSATATQLNAGTAYVTSINETPISAARAGNAANASLANSAWYDGTGRIISALPDEATVSSIASAYAESAASGKQDTLTFAWNADSAISSINGSALAGQGGGSPIVVTGTAWDPDTSAYVYDLSSNLSAAQRHVYSSQLDGLYSYIDKFLDDSANTYRLEASLIRAGAEQYASGWSSKFVYMPGVSMWSTADAATGVFTPLRYATGACLAMDVKPNFKAYYKGNEWFVADVRYGMLRGEIHQSRGLRIVASSTNSASGFQLHPSGVNGVDKNGSAWKYGPSENNNLSSVYNTVSANSASWGQGGVDSATVSAIASAYVESGVSSKLDTTAQVVTSIDETYPATGGTFISQINGTNIFAVTAHSAGDWIGASSKQDTLSFSYDDDKISAINGSALAGQGGVDSATVSSIASSYAESAASSKLDTTAYNSSDFYSTSNPSGFVDSAYVDSSVSGKMDASAIDYTRTGDGTQIYASGTGSSTNQFSAKNASAGAAIIAGENARLRLWDTAATANLYASSIGGWNAVSNLVSSQSANWGGSALALSAGPGVKLEKVGDTLVASQDRTLLWSGVASSTSFSAALSDNVNNFKYLEIYAAPSTSYLSARVNQGTKFIVSGDALGNGFYYVRTDNMESNSYWGEILYVNMYNGGTHFTLSNGCRWQNNSSFWTGIGSYRGAITNIIGINRTAEA